MRRAILSGLMALFVALLVLPAAGADARAPKPSAEAAESRKADYGQAIRRLEEAVEVELSRGIVSGVSVALVDDQRIVFAKGFGLADKARRQPATKEHVYRAGSISKLFTALAVMQLVEQGKLDLDQPVTRYDPDFRIVVPFEGAGPITLRQILCHRSGLVREAPVGGYLDPKEPSIEATVASIAPCVLVNPPNTVTRYSNLAVTVEGHIVANVACEPFIQYVRERLLDPIGMKHSSFALDDRVRQRLSTAYMRVADGKGGFRTIEAPHFELGTIPAGNLYTNVEDLGRFLSFLFAGGRAASERVVRPETLDQMFTPQLIEGDTGFGLGFMVGRFRDRKTVSHMGEVYGFTSSVVGLVEEKLGAVVLANEDIASGPVRKLSDLALGLLLEAKLGEKPQPNKEEPIEVSADRLKEYAGDFESESYWARVEPRDGVLQANISGQPLVLTPVGPEKFLADGRWACDAPMAFQRDKSGRVTGFTALRQEYRRIHPKKTPPTPNDWKKFCGSYGPEFIPLVISIKHGHLYAMTENLADYRLTPLNRYVFKMPPGLYADEQLVFQVGRNGRVHSAVLASMTLPRRGK